MLPRDFYQRPVLEVARDLLGMHLCHGARSGRIVEVEAYGGPEDHASHARLRKGAIMFGPGGVSYVYLIYGMHHCFNVVAHPEGEVGAVLVRALEPGQCTLPSCSGPARLCVALGIDRRHNGLDLTTPGDLCIEDRGTPVREVVATPRIGVDYAGADAALPYRLCSAGSGHLSRRVGDKSPS